MADLAGNHLFLANRSIGLLQTTVSRFDWIGGADSNDYYQFRVASPSRFSLALGGLRATANVELLNARGMVIQRSAQNGTLPEFMQRVLTTGTYYVRVYSGDRRSTPYSLRLSATVIPQVTVTTPNGGNLLTQGRGFWLRWTDNLAENVRIDLFRGSTFAQTITLSTPSDGLFYWIVPGNLPASPYYRLRISSTRNGAVLDWSNGFFRIAPPPRPDLVVQNPVAPTAITTGDWVHASATIRNSGTAVAAGSTVRYWLSNDATFSPTTDIFLGQGALTSLGIGAVAASNLTFSYNPAWGMGTRFILMQADGYSVLPEGNEANNLGYRAIAIQPRPLPAITLTTAQAAASETSGNPGEFTLTRTGDTSTALTVAYTVGGTAVNGTDYGTLSGTVTFAAGSATTTLTLTPIDDLLMEGEETVDVTLAAGNGYSLGNAISGTVTIADNDHAVVLPVITLATSDNAASETPGNPGQFTLTRTGSTAEALTVFYTLGGTASNGTDYNTLSGSVTFAAGSSTAVVTVNPIDDAVVDGSETVTLTLASGGNYTLGATQSGTVTIADNEVLPDPGNTLGSAELQNSPIFSRSQRVSSGDRDDLYRFTLSQSGVFTADLTGLSGDADVRLIGDFDSDGTIDTAQLYDPTTGILDAGEILAWQWERGTTSESLRRFLAAGTYYLQVSSYNNQTADYTLSTNFTAAASDSRQFSITPIYDAAINATARATIQKAINFWLAVIPHTSFNTAQNLTITFSPDATITSPTLATGGYTSTAIAPNGYTIPTAGQVKFSTGYLNNLNTIANFSPDTVTHEIAHVLGIVGLLNNSGTTNADLINETAGTYNGNTYAGWAYGELKGTYTPTTIPLTTGEGSGSDLAHWQEDVFGNELMTHLTRGAIASLSQLSLAALRDVGWKVNFGAAQPYALPLGGLASSLSTVAGTVTTPNGTSRNGFYSTSVSSEHLDRFYRFDFAGVGDLVANLTVSTGNADMRLIRDANANGVVDAGEVIAVSHNGGTTTESFDVSNLAAGSYYVQIYPSSSLSASGDRLIGEASYQLNYNAAASDAPITTSLSPVASTWNMSVGNYLPTTGMYSFVVGDRNIDDLLRFNFTGTTSLSFGLTGLTGDANMRLIRDANNNGQIDTGEIIQTSTNLGSTSETITASGLAAGSYYFHIFRADSSVTSTPYSFNLNSLTIT